jgi:hypothetical protein
VQDLLRSGKADGLVAAATTFYDLNDHFWHGFYNSLGYLALENSAKTDLQAPLTAVQGALTSARQAYTQGMEAIPQVKAVHTAEQRLYADLCQSSAQTASLPIGDPTADLCQRLNSMAQLARQLNSSTAANLQSSNRNYLPLLSR